MLRPRTTGRGPAAASCVYRWWFAAAASFGLLSSAALAQAPAGGDQAASADGSQLQEVVVTGSLIQRTDLNTPAPLQVISAGDIQASGASSVYEVLHALTANGQGNLNQSNSGSFASGAAGIALRGMTVDATLVLIDGQRMAFYPISDDGQRSFVDVANLPLDAIDHVEVLKDGASAVYGSDAIAGVVNIILKKTFEGVQVAADYGITGQNDAATYHASATWGMGNLEADGHNTYINLEWRHQDSLGLDARPKYADFDYYDKYTPGCGATGNCAPVGYGVIQPGNPFPIADTMQGMVAEYNPANPGVPLAYQLLSPCPNPTAGSANVLGGCEYDHAAFVQIQPTTTNINVLLRHSMKFGDNWTGTFTASMFESLAEQLDPANSTYEPFPLDSQDPSAQPILLPVGNKNNPYPANPAWLAYRFGDIGPTLTDTDTKMFRVVAELTGKVGDWNFTGSLGDVRGLTNLTYFNFATYSGINYALATNSYWIGANAYRNAGTNINTVIAPSNEATASSELQYVELNLTKNLFQLPGGNFGFAFGVGARHDGQSDPGQPAALSGNIPGFLTTFINGTESTENVHAEIDAQVFKWLEINAAGRFDNYADVGRSTTPKIGIKLQPLDWVSVRGTFGRGFRAPGPAERGNSGVEFFENEGIDPIRCPVTGLPNDCGQGSIAGVNGGNPNLRPERSTQYTLGLVFTPTRNLNLAVDWWQIRRTDEIIGGVGTPIVIRGPIQAAYPTVPGPILEELSPYENIGSDEPKGIDADLSASLDLATAGRLGLEAHYTHLISQVYCGFASPVSACVDVAGTHGPTGISGDTGTPKDKAEATVTWTLDPMEAGIVFNYVSGMSDTDPIVALDNAEPLNACLQSWWPACYTTAWYDFDLFGHYNISQNLQATLHIFNVFNQSAPFDYQAAYGQSNYNDAYEQQGAIGRFFQVGLRYRM